MKAVYISNPVHHELHLIALEYDLSIKIVADNLLRQALKDVEKAGRFQLTPKPRPLGSPVPSKPNATDLDDDDEIAL